MATRRLSCSALTAFLSLAACLSMVASCRRQGCEGRLGLALTWYLKSEDALTSHTRYLARAQRKRATCTSQDHCNREQGLLTSCNMTAKRDKRNFQFKALSRNAKNVSAIDNNHFFVKVGQGMASQTRYVARAQPQCAPRTASAANSSARY